jgi:hypothetical protein
MYRIELSPGEEAVFRSIEELAVAIKRGVVTPRARIFHNASSRWLPIQFHPHYKAALSMPLTQAALIAGPQSKPLSTLSLELPPEPDPEPEIVHPIAPEVKQAPERLKVVAQQEQPARKKKASSKQLAGENRNRRRSKPRRQLRIALIGALLIGGAQWVLSVPLFSRAKPALLSEVQRRLIDAHADVFKQVSPPNSAAMIPVLPSVATTGTPEVLQPARPERRLTTPSFGGTSSIETALVEPPPSDSPASSVPAGDSLAAKVVDSTNQKALRGILTTVSGGASSLEAPAKR